MFKNLAIGFATAATLSAAAFAVTTPALANYAPCIEEPSAQGCPAYIPPIPEGQQALETQVNKPAPHAHLFGRDRSEPRRG